MFNCEFTLYLPFFCLSWGNWSFECKKKGICILNVMYMFVCFFILSLLVYFFCTIIFLFVLAWSISKHLQCMSIWRQLRHLVLSSSSGCLCWPQHHSAHIWGEALCVRWPLHPQCTCWVISCLFLLFVYYKWL